MTQSPSSVRPRHRLLAWARRWHAWGGLLAALFLLVAGSTGVVLNYKKPILTALGLESREPVQRSKVKAADRPAETGAGFTTVTGFDAAAIPIAQALAAARERLGEVSLDRIELKRESGVLVWKVKAADEREVIVDATTGAAFLKGRYERNAAGGNSAGGGRSIDWGRIALDLHTGKIGGEVGKALMTVMALMLVFLSMSGVYLYAKPWLIRRANARARNRSVTAAPRARDVSTAPSTTPTPTPAPAPAPAVVCEGGPGT